MSEPRARERVIRHAGHQYSWLTAVSERALFAAAALIAFACQLALASHAQAAITHRFVSVLPEPPESAGAREPISVAIDHTTGQIFVGDDSNGVVDVYSASGAYETQLGEELEPASIAIDEANGDIYVADPAAKTVVAYRPDGDGSYQLLTEWSGAGTPSHTFGEVTAVAFDNAKEGGSDPGAGDLYVLESEAPDTGSGAIDLFKPRPNPTGVEEGEGQEGAFLRRIEQGPRLEEPNAIVVDSANGRVLVADTAKAFVATYSDTGAFEEKLTGAGEPFGSFKGKEDEEENVLGLAVEEASGDIYVAEGERHAISQYRKEGAWLGWSIVGQQAAPLQEPSGVAISAEGELYGADPIAGVVDRFASGVVVPDVITGKASKLTRVSASLAGTINGDGKAAKYSFLWGTSEALGQATAAQNAGSGEEKATTTLEGLQPGTTYFFRIVGENTNGVNYGLIHEFQTAPAVEGVNTGPVIELKPTSATLSGAFAPDGIDTHYHFQWGISTAYGNSTPTTDAGSGAGSFEAKAPLSDLSPNTTYHYRIVAENEFGATAASDKTLTTSGPPRITNEAPTGVEHEAVKLHAKVNPDGLATKYRLEYGATTAYGAEVPVGGASLGEGFAAVAVEASLSDLKIGTIYHYRVVAENGDETTIGPDQVVETVPPAPIDQSFVTEVGATTATLNADINPLGNETAYYFQYGTQSCAQNPGACTDVPMPAGDVGSGSGDVAKNEQLSGLQPSTIYFYRVLDSNVLGSTEGREHTFTTQAGEAPLALADDRTWEMVSPPDKHGAPIEAITREGGLILAAEDGNSITYVANGPITEQPAGNRSPEQQQVVSVRSPQGWSSQDIGTPHSKEQGVSAGAAPEYQFFTPDLAQALVEPWGDSKLSEPALAPEARQKTMYLRDNGAGSYLPLVTEANVATGIEFGNSLGFLSATSNLTHVVFQSQVPLLSGASGLGLYEWSGGALSLVSLLPGGATVASTPELGYFDRTLSRAISQDGSRIVWTNKEDFNTRGGHLYMRETVRGETVQLDAAQGAPEPEKGSAEFQTASPDGSRVFFTDRQRLTAESTAEPGSGTGKPDLYECEMVEQGGELGCDLKDLTVDHHEGEHAAVQGLLLGASEDATSIYLVAQGVLAENRSGNGETVEPGQDNLYLLHSGAGGWSTTFIARLSSEDRPEWEGNGVGNTSFLTARVSPNGRYLAFMSSASPTGYDNTDQNSGAHDEEVYLYDAEHPSLRCVSCNPTGARPTGVFDTLASGEGIGPVADRRQIWTGHWLAGNVPGWTAESISDALFQSRYLGDEGRLFFNSPDDLVPQATNHKEDVYEYEPTGVGSCESSSGGCVSLISAGNSSNESAFLEATPNGNNVFFLTATPLLPQDTDTAFDIYDARVCTAESPCLTPPPPAPEPCRSDDACRPAAPAQLAPSAPAGTASVAGSSSAPAVTAASHESKGAKAAIKPKPLTRAQRLAKSLTSCRRQFAHSKHKRRACEAHARKLYGPKLQSKRSRAKKSGAGGPARSGNRGTR